MKKLLLKSVLAVIIVVPAFASAPAAIYTPEELEQLKIYNEDVTQMNERRAGINFVPYSIIPTEGSRCEPGLLAAAQEHVKRVRWEKYKKEKTDAISQAIKNEDYMTAQFGVRSLAHQLNERYGKASELEFLNNTLSEAIHANNPLMVRALLLELPSENAENVRKVFNPQGKPSLLELADQNRKEWVNDSSRPWHNAGISDSEAIYKKILEWTQTPNFSSGSK